MQNVMDVENLRKLMRLIAGRNVRLVPYHKGYRQPMVTLEDLEEVYWVSDEDVDGEETLILVRARPNLLLFKVGWLRQGSSEVSAYDVHCAKHLHVYDYSGYFQRLDWPCTCPNKEAK